MVTDVPFPEVVIPPGVRVITQTPVDGNLLRTTLPLASSQVGWVLVPIFGAAGVGG